MQSGYGEDARVLLNTLTPSLHTQRQWAMNFNTALTWGQTPNMLACIPGGLVKWSWPSKWRKKIRDDWCPQQVWVGERFFWYWLIWVVLDKIHRAVNQLCVVSWSYYILITPDLQKANCAMSRKCSVDKIPKLWPKQQCKGTKLKLTRLLAAIKLINNLWKTAQYNCHWKFKNHLATI